jgi:nitroimidazol reductase NimA-like FMN-containing flavoprotein (pyridoxamine 5'-phosphate oxidase superfamily)
LRDGILYIFDKKLVMFGILNPEEIEALLYSQILGRIGCHIDNTPYVVPISYAYDGEFIYAVTREGLKVNIMRQNHHVCFEVEDIPDMGNWKSVICWGEYEELPNRTERHQALLLLHDRQLPLVTSATTRLSPTWPFRPDNIDVIKGVVFRIRLYKKTGRFEKQEEEPIYSWE